MYIDRNSPIALIDSGIGGLSMLKELSKKYPNENYIYLADNAYMPYGNKSARALKNRILNLTQYLYNTFNVKLVILACNTASAATLNYVNKHSSVKVLGLNLNELIPSNQPFKLLCTKLSAKHYGHLNACACNRLASAIEQNYFDTKHLDKAIKSGASKHITGSDAIVLGCSHYELVYKRFQSIWPNVKFVRPCQIFVKNFKPDKPNPNLKGNILMMATLATKSYIDKLWKIFNH